MKLFFALSLTLVSSLFVISCNDSSAETSSHEHEQHTTTQSSPELTSSEITGMTLNNGQKWQMDEHTHFILTKMKASVMLTDITSASTEQLKALGDTLTLQLDELIQGCTMEGAEHDQLHIFLTAYIPELKTLTNTGSSEAAKNINFYLNSYSHYFQ